MSASCNCCGDCCDPVTLAYTKNELRAQIAKDEMTEQDRAFILEHWTQLPMKEGLHRAAYFNGKLDRLARANVETGEVEVQADRSVFYECEFFDTEPLLEDGTRNPTYRMCTAHDSRPPICDKFPTKLAGGWPSLTKFLPLDCSYRQDQIDLVAKNDAQWKR